MRRLVTVISFIYGLLVKFESLAGCSYVIASVWEESKAESTAYKDMEKMESRISRSKVRDRVMWRRIKRCGCEVESNIDMKLVRGL